MHMEPAALDAGKPVATEKPLAGTLADARTMVEAAKQAKVPTFVWYNYRRVPAVALAYQLVQEGRIGRVYHVRCVYLQDWGGPDTPLAWRFQKKLAGSGAHGDLNAHVDSDPVSDSDEHAHIDSDPHFDKDPHSHDYADVYPDGHTDLDAHVDPDPDSDPDEHAHVDPNAHLDPYADVNLHEYSDFNPDPDAIHDPYPDT